MQFLLISSKKIKRFFTAGIVFTSVLFSSAFVYSQNTIEQSTQETSHPLGQEIVEETLNPPAPKIQEWDKEQGPESKDKNFFIKEIILSGGESLPRDVLKPVLEKYENKTTSLPQLNILVKEIEKIYLEKGVFVICYIPPQKIKSGKISIEIIETRLGELKIEDHKHFNKERLRYYWHIRPGELLDYYEMYKDLQLMNKNPDRAVKAVMRAGEKPKTTDVILKAKTKLPLHANYTFDKEGNPFTGIDRHNIMLENNNFLLRDDRLLGGYSFGNSFEGLYIYHLLPISGSGRYILYGYNYTKGFPKKEYTTDGINARARNASFYVHQDIFNKSNSTYAGELFAGIDAKDKTISTNAGTYNRDRLRIMSIGGKFINRKSTCISQLNTKVSQGLNIWGARKRNELSSRGGKNNFTRLNIEISHKTALPLKLQGNLKMACQVASTKLNPQEEYTLGGINSVRGYPSADFLADNALQLNLELLSPAFFIPEKIHSPFSENKLKDDINLLTFFDYGYGYRKGSQNPQKRFTLKSAGAGIRIKLFNKISVSSLRLEWGFQLGDDPLTQAGNSRFHLSIDTSF